MKHPSEQQNAPSSGTQFNQVYNGSTILTLGEITSPRYEAMRNIQYTNFVLPPAGVTF